MGAVEGAVGRAGQAEAVAGVAVEAVNEELSRLESLGGDCGRSARMACRVAVARLCRAASASRRAERPGPEGVSAARTRAGSGF